jgi:hypothetical protein
VVIGRSKTSYSQGKQLIVIAILIFKSWDLAGSVEQTPINKPVGWNGITIEQLSSSPGLAKFSKEEHEALFPDEIIIENASWQWGNAYTIKPKYGHMKVNQLKPGAPIANLGTRPSTSGFSRATTHSSSKLNAAANNGNGNQGGNRSKAEKQFQKLLAQLQKSAEVGDKMKIKFEIGSKSLEKDVIDTSTDHQTWKKMLSLVKTTSQGNDKADITPHSIRTKSGQQFTSLRKGKARMYGLYVGKNNFVVYDMCHKNNQETVINKLDTISVYPQASIEPNSIDFD